MKLRVIEPFNGYQVGQEIADQKEIDAVLNSDQIGYVVKVAGDTPTQAKEASVAKQ